MEGHLECANCGRDVSEVEDARTAGLRVFCCRRCYVFSSRTREVPPWGREHAEAWADPWEDLSPLPFADLVGVILNLCLLDFARARKDLEMSRMRGPDGGGGVNGALERLAAARQLTERIREAPAYYEPAATDLEAYRAERLGAIVPGDYDVDLVRVSPDSVTRPFVPAVCVTYLAMNPLDTPELISNVDHAGPQLILEHVSHQDAENLEQALERFGFTVDIRASAPAPPLREIAAPQKAIATEARREAARGDGG